MLDPKKVGRAVIACPFIPVSAKIGAHRAAEAVIYAEQLKTAGFDVSVVMSQHLHIDNWWEKFDTLFVFHGKEWTGRPNLFGGMDSFPYIWNTLNFMKFKGDVYSLMIPMPDLEFLLKHKIKLRRDAGMPEKVSPVWDTDADWDNLKCIQEKALKNPVIDPNLIKRYPRVCVGDSHAVSMYRPEWMVFDHPFKTLYGALNAGLDTFFPNDPSFKEIEFYFGNIDVRHHLCRQPDPLAATEELAFRYVIEAQGISKKYEVQVTLYELLPIENERRRIPTTGWYQKTPFFGSWEERNAVRDKFNRSVSLAVEDTPDVSFFSWTSGLKNKDGELDFKYMEVPQSVHLSRAAYPHWQGLDWNKIEPLNTQSLEKSSSLDRFFNE